MNGGWWLGAGGQAGGGTGWGPRGPARAAAAQDFSRGGGWDTPPPTPCAGQRGSEEGSGGGQRRLRGRGGPAATLGRRRGGGGASPVGPAERPLGGSPRDPPPPIPTRATEGGPKGSVWRIPPFSTHSGVCPDAPHARRPARRRQWRMRRPSGLDTGGYPWHI